MFFKIKSFRELILKVYLKMRKARAKENLFRKKQYYSDITRKLYDLIKLSKKMVAGYDIVRPLVEGGPLIIGGNLWIKGQKHEFLCFSTAGKWQILTLKPANDEVQIIVKFICYVEYNPVIDSNLRSKLEFVLKIV